MRRRDVLVLGASLVGTMAARRVFAQQEQPLVRAAVVIGVNTAGDLPVLTAAASGAHSVADWLASEGFEVKPFVDDGGPVKIAAIKAAIAELVDRGTLDQLVVYFSGHGFLASYSEHWMLSGAPDDPDEAVSFTESFMLAQQTGIPNVVLISDACRSTPDSLRAAQVRGSLIFPNHGVRSDAAITKVDRFFAALPGDAALEAPLGDNARQYEGIYTSVFLDAFSNPDADMVLKLPSGGEVVPNRKLENFLRREVQKRAQAKNIALNQLPETEVVSGDAIFIGHVAGDLIGSAEPPPPEPSISDVVGAALENIDSNLFAATTKFRAESIDQLATMSGFTAAREVLVSTSATSTSGMATGFVVYGSGVESVATDPAAPTQVGINGDHTEVRVDLSGPETTLALRFSDGSGTVVACLRDFVGNIVVDGGGVSNVNYDIEGQRPDDFILHLRAVVAAAARLGVFRIDGDGEEQDRRANELANTVRMGKFSDPTLGLYAAYAYNEASLPEQIASVAKLMEENLNTLLFDVALLTGALRGRAAAGPGIVPPCPMLSQGWSLLRVFDVHLPEAFEAARDHLRPALWTTFEPAGMEIIMAALQSGRVQ